ncbi:flagellar filament capping protein FliD [Gemmatimonas sp.]|uniref:flagellar filament capping protein FliD n=1 Tax=Gemmatimonas sp. TaxID=1962908 RepID=UPI00333EE123
MTTSLNISGLSSNIQWGDVVDATIKAMEARTVTPISDQIAKRSAQKEAWNQFRTLVNTLNTNSLAVRRGGIGGYLANVPTSPTSGRSLFSAAASTTAAPGKYRVEVLQLADAAKLSGGSVSDVGAARGLTGTFSINGKEIAVATTDTLRTIQEKINAANTGTSPSGVTASIVSEGGTAGRLVLTSTTNTSTGITLSDGTGGMARELGLIDTRSKPVSSATQSVAAAMGLSVFPSPASIRVGNKVIVADLSTDSLTSIAAKINAAGGSASVEPEQFGSETRFRLLVEGNVSADNGDPISQEIIDTLGFAAGSTGTVRQTVQSAALTNGGSPVTAATPLTALGVGGTPSGLAVGDAINIRGTRGDGTAVTVGLVIGSGDTMQTLLGRFNDATNGFKSGSRTATAGLGDDGRIRLTDDTGGGSRLSFSMSFTKADGTTGTLGATETSVPGRSRELQVGKEAIVRVDGREIRRATNAITDAISGVTLNLTSAEPGTAIDVTVERDQKTAVENVQAFADSYNAIRKFLDEQRQPDSPLYANSSLRRTVETFTAALRTKVTGNETFSSLAVTGLALDRFGTLVMNKETFSKALADKPEEVEKLFGFDGVGTAFVNATDDATRFSTGSISSQITSIDNSTVSLRLKETTAKSRLDLRREQLVQQYTRMEEALARLRSQSSGLLGTLNSLQQNQN